MSSYDSFAGRVYGFLLAVIIITPSICVLDVARSSGSAALIATLLVIVVGVGLLGACFWVSDQSALKFLQYGNHWAILPISILSLLIARMLWTVKERWRS